MNTTHSPTSIGCTSSGRSSLERDVPPPRFSVETDSDYLPHDDIEDKLRNALLEDDEALDRTERQRRDQLRSAGGNTLYVEMMMGNEEGVDGNTNNNADDDDEDDVCGFTSCFSRIRQQEEREKELYMQEHAELQRIYAKSLRRAFRHLRRFPESTPGVIDPDSLAGEGEYEDKYGE
eukprot:PhM_4_TR13200/c0_g1_i1/m.53093